MFRQVRSSEKGTGRSLVWQVWRKCRAELGRFEFGERNRMNQGSAIRRLDKRQGLTLVWSLGSEFGERIGVWQVGSSEN